MSVPGGGVAAWWLTSMCVPTVCSRGQSRQGMIARRHAHSISPTMKPVAKTSGIAWNSAASG